MARLLICITCKSIEPIPDYDGPLEMADVPAPDGTLQPAMVPPMGADSALDYVTAPHARGEHIGNLVQVDEKEWRDNSSRVEILKQIREGLTHGVQGLGAEVYAFKDTLKEDALKCFEKHGRPEQCIDYHDRSKLLSNALMSEDEKEALKKSGVKRTKHRYLCDFCPVQANVQRKKFEKEKLYE